MIRSGPRRNSCFVTDQRNGRTISTYLTPETLAALDLAARRRGITKAAIMRRLIEEYLAAAENVEAADHRTVGVGNRVNSDA